MQPCNFSRSACAVCESVRYAFLHECICIICVCVWNGILFSLKLHSDFVSDFPPFPLATIFVIHFASKYYFLFYFCFYLCCVRFVAFPLRGRCIPPIFVLFICNSILEWWSKTFQARLASHMHNTMCNKLHFPAARGHLFNIVTLRWVDSRK